MKKENFSSPIVMTMVAALLFGASTPIAKYLLQDAHPVLLAGLLYLGSGIGLLIVRFIRDHGWKKTGLLTQEWRWLVGTVSFGGILGPVLLMMGLTLTEASTASLLLNMEGVLTCATAWIFFKENTDYRIVLGMLLIVGGGCLLSWPHQQGSTLHGGLGSLFIFLACLCWAIDNNLTRKISGADSLFIAGIKGLVAGIVNTGLSYIIGISLPKISVVSLALLCGFMGYGFSLFLFILGLRGLGTARAGAYFSVAPFIGAAMAILLFHEAVSSFFWLASILMGIGIWLHLTERHEHEHSHEAIFHDHWHTHDEHHQHEHSFQWNNTKGHRHPHQHEALIHSHTHYPDLHHRHKH
jgi:drug/metabolite transporter (DMT)-like permease